MNKKIRFQINKYTPTSNLFLFLIGIILMGCADERADVIASYVQSRGKAEIFNGFTLKHIRSLGSISASDSLEILGDEYIRKKKKFIQDYNVLISTSQSLKRVQEERNKVHASANDQLIWVSELEKRAAEGTASALVFKQRELMELRTIANRMARYNADPGMVLARKAKITYTIKNPLTNETNREMSRTFIFSTDNKKVLAVIE